MQVFAKEISSFPAGSPYPLITANVHLDYTPSEHDVVVVSAKDNIITLLQTFNIQIGTNFATLLRLSIKHASII